MTARPTSIAKITAPSARCSVCVQADSCVSTWSPPTTTWTANSAAAPTARRTSTGRPCWVRQAATARPATITPTTAATQRWRTWVAVTSVNGGSSEPLISGQSGKTSADSLAVTWEPNSSKANVATVANAASSVNRWLAPPTPSLAGMPARTVTYTSSAKRSRAAARCAVTDSPLFPRRTVSRPSHAWKPTKPTAPIDGHSSDGRSRWSSQARIASPRISNPMRAATVRWVHSIQALVSSSGGSSWPWHSGQSGHPRPDPVARTMTPMVTSRIAVPRVVAASFWKRVTGSPGARGLGAQAAFYREAPGWTPDRGGSATLRP